MKQRTSFVRPPLQFRNRFVRCSLDPRKWSVPDEASFILGVVVIVRRARSLSLSRAVRPAKTNVTSSQHLNRRLVRNHSVVTGHFTNNNTVLLLLLLIDEPRAQMIALAASLGAEVWVVRRPRFSFVL
jgi:hypothetical protein